VIAQTGIGSLSALSNQLVNLAMYGASGTIGDYLSSITVPTLTRLDSLTTVLPADIAAALATALGSGSGPYGNPVLADLIGTAAGIVHRDSFVAIGDAANQISSTAAGTSLVTTATALRNAIVLNSGISAAYAAFQSAVTAFNSFTAKLPAVTAANQAITASGNQLKVEQTNLALANITLYSGVTSTGVTGVELANFVGRLHDFGVDQNQHGYVEILSGIASDDLTGDAVRAALIEGQNSKLSRTVGKTTPAMA
jgi:hypothetical protein